MKIQLPTILVIAACCTVGAILSYVLMDGHSGTLAESASEQSFVPSAGDGLPPDLATHAGDSPAPPVRVSGDILDAEGNQRWRKPVELASVGHIVLPEGASRSEPRRRVGVVLRDGIPVAEPESPFNFIASTRVSARPATAPWATSGVESVKGNTSLAPLGRAADRQRSPGSSAASADGVGFSNPTEMPAGLTGGTGPNEQPLAGRTAKPAGLAASAPENPDGLEPAGPPLGVSPKGNFSREDQLLRTLVGWQAFAQIMNERALQKITQEREVYADQAWNRLPVGE